MKFLSIKLKITLWYTLFMIGLTSVVLGVVVELTDMSILSNQKHELVKEVESAAEDIEEGDDFDYFDDGVYLSRYSADFQYIEGSIPERFPLSILVKEGRVQTIKESDEVFYVYDQKVIDEYGRMFWVRGIIPNVQMIQLSRIIIGAAFITLPILVILSSSIGYFITKKAFLPVKKIQETAQRISESNQLSMRIGLPEGKDEISMLGKTVDNMLEQLEKSFEKEKQFTSDASHELRTPVAVIMAESEYIIKHGESLEEAKESMEIINYQAEKMSALINQLLFFSRAEQGRIQLKYEKIDVAQVISNIINDMKILASEKNISITMENSISIPEYFVDRILFERALQNILQNAITYGKENGYIRIKLYVKDEYFAVKIEDNGIGISRENLNKIWDRFYQVDEARTGQKSGSMGLGLSMVKWIMEKHKGYTEVESILGEGTTFTLFFPIKNNL